MAVRPRTFRPLRVASVDRLCADAAAVTFEPPVTAADEAGEYDFRAGQSLTLRRHDGYDHGYFFIASFIEDHLRFHADALKPA